MARVTVTVTVTDDSLPRLAEVVDRLRAAGMVVGEVHEPLGAVTGSAEAGAVPALRGVPGVDAVELGRDYQIPPGEGPRDRR